MPVVIFFACLDLKQKSSFLDGHYLIFIEICAICEICGFKKSENFSLTPKLGKLAVFVHALYKYPKNQIS
jgi:hypothetical protein